jgi:hypothetical protein
MYLSSLLSNTVYCEVLVFLWSSNWLGVAAATRHCKRVSYHKPPAWEMTKIQCVFLLNIHCFCTMIKWKNHKLNHYKLGAIYSFFMKIKIKFISGTIFVNLIMFNILFTIILHYIVLEHFNIEIVFNLLLYIYLFYIVHNIPYT